MHIKRFFFMAVTASMSVQCAQGELPHSMQQRHVPHINKQGTLAKFIRGVTLAVPTVATMQALQLPTSTIATSTAPNSTESFDDFALLLADNITWETTIFFNNTWFEEWDTTSTTPEQDSKKNNQDEWEKIANWNLFTERFWKTYSKDNVPGPVILLSILVPIALYKTMMACTACGRACCAACRDREKKRVCCHKPVCLPIIQGRAYPKCCSCGLWTAFYYRQLCCCWKDTCCPNWFATDKPPWSGAQVTLPNAAAKMGLAQLNLNIDGVDVPSSRVPLPSTSRETTFTNS